MERPAVAGRLRAKSLSEEDFCEVVSVPGGEQSFVLDTQLFQPPGPSKMPTVTGTIRHRNAAVWDLTFDDRTVETFGVTANHPLYSETRHAWIPAGDLQFDEVVRTLNGHSTLTARTQRPTRETVFKLEDWVVKNTALGKFFSEGMAQFYGSWKVWPSIHKDWDYVKKTDGLTRTGLIIQIIGVSYAEWRIYLGIAELMDEE